MRDKIKKIILETPHMNEGIDKIIALFKDYRNINEPIMKKCDEFMCENGKVIHVNRLLSNRIEKPCPTCEGEGEVPVMIEVECEYYIEDIPCRENKDCKYITVGFGDYLDCKMHGKITRPLTVGEGIEWLSDLLANSEGEGLTLKDGGRII